ncbi:F-box/FBD/LRR-repeat protein At4g26340-like isoform X1 [Cicer arietinum]|uniref:F-box/FBD/LRR-repeat protein At4g26340-like isoform X2 n=1 Tax=Cicer arietinum TaxID=3827 RepID=A0A3Q7XID4_CICAR|nr:F-box/FBD/LRR-repeat protein At4g26340-like isoform X2 [Cicer arietinum]
MAESSSKQKKLDENTSIMNIDRISSLPDSVLCHILSFLTAKTCVATSLLSRRWRHVWENIQVLEFREDFHDCYEDDDDFEQFKQFSVLVNGVLTLRRSRDIRKFVLSCRHTHEDMFYANSVATWVRVAIGPRLEELELSLFSSDGEAFVMPYNLFTCTNLVSLSLCGGIHVKLHSSTKINLPSLKILQLDIDSVDCIDTLLSGCSTLESLDICFAPKCLSTIRMPHSLKSLKIGVENNDIGTHFEIVSPGLEYLSINQITAFGPITVCNFPEVTQVFLDVFSLEESVNALLNLLLAISATNTLELRRSTTKEPSPLQIWVEPTSAPQCIVSVLDVFYIRGFQGYGDEVEFVAYLLRKGLVLTRIHVICSDVFTDERTKYRILKRLSFVPRASTKCKLIFE